jgi:hypothetical protein
MTCMRIKVLTHVLVQNLGDINDHAPLDVEQPPISPEGPSTNGNGLAKLIPRGTS